MTTLPNVNSVPHVLCGLLTLTLGRHSDGAWRELIVTFRIQGIQLIQLKFEGLKSHNCETRGLIVQLNLKFTSLQNHFQSNQFHIIKFI